MFKTFRVRFFLLRQPPAELFIKRKYLIKKETLERTVVLNERHTSVEKWMNIKQNAFF
jgi:hypothetical protein